MSENSFDSMLTKITQNSELMNKITEIVKSSKGESPTDALPEVMEEIKKSLNSEGSREAPQNNGHRVNDIKADKENFESVSAKNNKNALGLDYLSNISGIISKNSALLLALRPYLGKERGEIIDSIIKLSKLSEILKLANL